MNFAARQAIYREIEKERKSKVLALVTGARPPWQTQIAGDLVPAFVSLLDEIGPVPKISLILDTHGGYTSVAWRLIHLLRAFGDEVEIIVPDKAMSAGTLMALGADQIVMSKQAALGPIDPSLTSHPLNPTVGGERVPVSAEAVRGFMDEVKKDVKDPAALASVWINLASQVHPLILGQIFRLGAQIRLMAKSLIERQVKDEKTQNKIIDFLCSESGSHDYTIDRKLASSLGLKIEKCSKELYPKIIQLTKSYNDELKTFEPFAWPNVSGVAPRAPFTLVRGLIEATEVGCYGYVSEGQVEFIPAAPGGQDTIAQNFTFEGWRKL